MNQTAEAMLASMHRDAKIAEARKRHGKPFAHEHRVTRTTPKSRLLEDLNSSAWLAHPVLA